MEALFVQHHQAIGLGCHHQLPLKAGRDVATQLQRLYGDHAAGLGHGAGVGFAVAVTTCAFDLDAVLAPWAADFVRQQDQGTLDAVEPVAGYEHAAGERLAALREFGRGDCLLCLLGHGVTPGKRRPPVTGCSE